MASSRRILPLSTLLTAATWSLVGFCPDAARANAIASWWVDTDEDYAPQVFKYNATTGIHASLCNSISTPIYAENSSTVLETAIAPNAGSSIASLGYVSNSTTPSTIKANVFYLADLDGESTITSASYTCNTTTGRWSPSGAAYNGYVSNGTNSASGCSSSAAPAIDPAGGLSALYLGDGDGMRVFFKTAEFQTHYLQYLPASADCPGWSYAGIASNLSTGHEVVSAFLPSKPKVWTIAQTVFVNESTTAADTEGEVEVSTSNADGVEDLWSINRMPTQIIAELKEDNTTAGILTNMSTTADSAYRYVGTDSWGFNFDAFSAAAARLGAAVNSGGIPSVFYVGDDGYLRRFAADTQGHWHEDNSEDDSKWPAADAASADFGLAYDAYGNRIWAYYESQGRMVQAYQSAVDVWEDFAALATYNASLDADGTLADPSSSSSSSGSDSGSGSSASSSSSASLSTSAKTGVGVGLGLGIPLLCAALAAVFLLRRRRRRHNDLRRAQLEGAGGLGGSGGKDDHDGRYPTGTTATTTTSPSPHSPGGPTDQNQGYWQDGMWIEKTATAYYAGGPGAAARRAEQLGELPVVPVYEMPGHNDHHEMPAGP